ncbi:hypothetical protein RCC89_14810 [Cytophagaceae bacterium ABcell3]|nr:hypothetical protein RCC89_14810 [Cytophagaceae bacterium ABcell3]
MMGQDPASIRWKQVNTDNFQVIFPEGVEDEGKRLTNILEAIYSQVSSSLEHEPKKVSVILHNQSVVANGFVSYAPFRQEMFSISPQDIYPQDWLEQLAIHEFRHVVQLDKINQGVTRLLYFLFGEQAIGAVLGLYIHPWFFEGDAVLEETVHSKAGRGRLPSFEMPLKAQVIEKGVYSYEKGIHGSFKDFVPDFYTTGYFLVASGRAKHGAGLWQDALNYPARKPHLITPFSRAIKKHTGVNKWGFYNETMRELLDQWIWRDSIRGFENYIALNQDPRSGFTNYRYPVLLNDSVVIAQKSGLGHYPQFVTIYPDGSEERLHVPGYSSMVKLSAKAGKVVWSEYTFDKRWDNRVWSDIVSYDVSKRKRKRLTRKRYLHAPDLSPDGEQMVTVETLPDNTYALVVLNANGEETMRYGTPGGNFPITPSWSESGKEIVFVLLRPEGKSIEMLDVPTGQISTILSPGFDDISLPVMHGNEVFFHGTWSGTDNIYRLDIQERKVYQITNAHYGARDISIASDGSEILFADYTADGYNVVRLHRDHFLEIPLDSVVNHSLALHEHIMSEESHYLTDSIEVSDTDHETKRYSKLRNLLNIHSWGPISYDFSSDRVDAGLSLLSQNLLSTTVVNAGYRYNLFEQQGGLYSTVSYLGWYPVLNANVSRTNRFLVDAEQGVDRQWIENSVGGSIVLPLNLTRNKYRRGLSASLSGNLLTTEWISEMPDEHLGNKFLFAGYNLFAFRYHRMAPRDLRPEWGQSVRINFRHAPLGADGYRSVFSVNTQFFMPGLFKHHSLRLSGVYQHNGPGTLAFQSIIPFPRGYFIGFEKEMKGIYSDYHFPLFYPDWRIGPLLYIQRFSMAVFADFAQGVGTENGMAYRSVGAELYSDFHLVNFVFPLNIGVRFSYLPITERTSFEIIYNLAF